MHKEERGPVYSISIAAHLLKVTPRLLRSFEEAGLILPHRTSGNTRLYSERDLQKLSVICYLHQVKEVNLPGIKIILSIIATVSYGSDRAIGDAAKGKGRETEAELWEKIRELGSFFPAVQG